MERYFALGLLVFILACRREESAEQEARPQEEAKRLPNRGEEVEFFPPSGASPAGDTTLSPSTGARSVAVPEPLPRIVLTPDAAEAVATWMPLAIGNEWVFSDHAGEMKIEWLVGSRAERGSVS
jgi:hypothetical protein